MTDTISERERRVPTWKQAVLAAALVFIVTFGVSVWVLDWLTSLVLAVCLAIFAWAIAGEDNAE